MKPAHEWMLEIIQAAEELGYQIRYVGKDTIGLTTPDAGHFVDGRHLRHLRQRRGSASAVGTSERGNLMTERNEIANPFYGAGGGPSQVESDQFVATPSADDDLLEAAWGIIANASSGNWDKQSKEWQEAAKRWRGRYFDRGFTTAAIEDESWNAALAAVEKAVGGLQADPVRFGEPSASYQAACYGVTQAIASLRKPVVR